MSSGAVGWGEASGAAVVREVLAANRIVRVLHRTPEVDSTQDGLRALAIAGAPAGTALVADRQRAGRGRIGRRWEDHPSGGNLAISVLLEVGRSPLDGSTVHLVPHALGLAVVDAARALGSDRMAVGLKWPNDVVHRPVAQGPGRKLAGVLVEREHIPGGRGGRDVLLCGIGVNVDLGDGVQPDRIDLASLLGVPPDRPGLLAALLAALDDAVGALAGPTALLDRYRGVSDTIGRTVRAELPGEAPLVGVVTAIDDQGRLLIDVAGRTRSIISGTIRDADETEALQSRDVGEDGR